MTHICSAERRVLLYLDHDMVYMSLQSEQLVFIYVFYSYASIFNCFVGVYSDKHPRDALVSCRDPCKKYGDTSARFTWYFTRSQRPH